MPVAEEPNGDTQAWRAAPTARARPQASNATQSACGFR